jgi:hypothetical protein
MIKPQYPSLGDITKILFDHSGVLPKKNGRTGIDEKTKKSIQTQLRRLAQENSELTSNLLKLFDCMAAYILEATECPRVTHACLQTIDDVFVQYKDFLRGDGTFLSKSDSAKWLIKNKLLDRLILSYQKNMLKFNVSASNHISPSDRFWWLPDITKQSIEWPIAKAFDWMYRIAETNQTHFHFPEFGFADNYRLAQNLENVSRWSTGRNIPSWASLLQNLNDSLTAMEHTQSNHQRVVDAKSRDSFRTILFIARFSTSVFIGLERQFGLEFLLEITTHIKKQNHRLSKIHDHFKSVVTTGIHSQPIKDPDLIDLIWLEETNAFWESKVLDIQYGSECINTRFVDKSQSGFSVNDLKYFLRYLDSFNLCLLLKQAQSDAEGLAPPRYLELLCKGLMLRKSPDTSNEIITEFVEEVKNSGLEIGLLWLTCWMWGTYHYRRAEDNLAFPFYLEAFENGKYAAGHNQYLLVNQFVECCAKNNKWRDFKKGIAWANYLGINVRWYRGFDESEDRLKNTFDMLKIARYAQL